MTAAALFACQQPSEQEPPPPLQFESAPATLADQVCSGLYACACNNANDFSSQAACVTEKRSEYELLTAGLLAAGAVWDPDCAGRMLEAFSRWECIGPSAAAQESLFDPWLCPVFKGPVPVGADCNTVSFFGDLCVPGSTCLGGTCTEVSVPAAVGERCRYNWDDIPCATGSYCTYSDELEDEVCVALPLAGDPCESDWHCGPASNGLHCDLAATICAAAPSAGQPCGSQNRCAPGNYCDGGKDFTCQPKFELGDGCSGSAVCPDDAFCSSNNICEPTQAQACVLAYAI